MIALHSSDLHGAYCDILYQLENANYDIWIDTGDFMPDDPNAYWRGPPYGGPEEQAHQKEWLIDQHIPEQCTKALNGRPCIIVPGNHDRILLAQLLKEAGANAHSIVDGSERHIIGDHVFAGFRHISWICGDWAGELPQSDFAPIVERTFAQQPTVLCTHAPATGILGRVRNEEVGINMLASYLRYEDHKVRHHLFGHIHEHGGQTLKVGDTYHHNGSAQVRRIDLSV